MRQRGPELQGTPRGRQRLRAVVRLLPQHATGVVRLRDSIVLLRQRLDHAGSTRVVALPRQDLEQRRITLRPFRVGRVEQHPELRGGLLVPVQPQQRDRQEAPRLLAAGIEREPAAGDRSAACSWACSCAARVARAAMAGSGDVAAAQA